MMKTNLKLLSCVLFWTVMFINPLPAEDLTLEMIYKQGLFSVNKVKGIRSMRDGLHYTVLENSHDIIKYSYATGENTDTLFSLAWTEDLQFSEISSYNLSKDETMLIFSTEQEKIYRYSYQSSYYVYDITRNKIIPVYSRGKQFLAEISPDGSKVAFVFENNIYMKDINKDQIVQITHDGLKNNIINGVPDWLYEEEFALKTGYYWSPDSRKLAYYRFDESDVREYSLILYDSIYPELFSYKYPKVGDKNPIVDIYVYDVMKGVSKKMELAGDSDCYIPRVKWLPTSDRLCIKYLNRLQKKTDFYIADVTIGTSHVFYSEENPRYIIDFADDFITFIDSANSAIIISEQDGFKHLYHYSITGTLINQVTKGNWEIEEFCGIDENSNLLYFTSTEASPLERHLYSINLDGTNKRQLSKNPGYHSASFSQTFKYFILTSSNANTPHQVSLFNRQGELIRVLENNDIIRFLAYHYHFSKKEFFTFSGGGNTELNGFMILPPKFKKHKKYPVLIYVYGGPESQMVANSWDNRLAWLQLLAQKGYIVACADNRGTNGRGEAFRKSIYMNLGKYEVEDQIALARYLESRSYVDKSRIGLFGWSYGGYISLLCMMLGNDVFKTGVAVAPVTDWKFYDTVYTERYMRRPDENEEGYYNGSALNYIDMLKGNMLIIHGLADDNVHFQHTAELITKIKEENKNISMFIYPNENHLMRGKNALYHVYNQATKFILNNL